jgi:hypothetical protein
MDHDEQVQKQELESVKNIEELFRREEASKIEAREANELDRAYMI